MDWKAILKWLPLISVGAAGVYGWATLRADVNNLQRALDKLEIPAAPQPFVANRVTKGDLCRVLFTAITSTGQKDKLDRLTKEIGKLDCYEGVAAMYVEAEPGQAASVNALLKEPNAHRELPPYVEAQPRATPPNR